MACKTEANTVAVQDMFEGDAPIRTVSRAIDDARIFVDQYGGTYTADLHTLLLRYYACHLLYIWGFANRLTSVSADDLSQSAKDLELGDKENSSSYLVEFHKLLPSDDLFITI